MIGDPFSRFFEDLVGRLSGPMQFRLVLQPVMALIFAVRDGLKDAKAGKPAYFYALFTDGANRGAMLKDGWKSVGRVFLLGIVMDAIYQFIAIKKFYPGEMIVVAFVLAFIPYLLIRGPVNRIARHKPKKTIG
jgi:hypothetical protein